MMFMKRLRRKGWLRQHSLWPPARSGSLSSPAEQLLTRVEFIFFAHRSLCVVRDNHPLALLGSKDAHVPVLLECISVLEKTRARMSAAQLPPRQPHLSIIGEGLPPRQLCDLLLTLSAHTYAYAHCCFLSLHDGRTTGTVKGQLNVCCAPSKRKSTRFVDCASRACGVAKHCAAPCCAIQKPLPPPRSRAIACSSAPLGFRPLSGDELAQLSEIASWKRDSPEIVHTDVTRAMLCAGLVLDSSAELTISNELARALLVRLSESPLLSNRVCFVSPDFACMIEGESAPQSREELLAMAQEYCYGSRPEEADRFILLRRDSNADNILSDTQAWQFADIWPAKSVARVYDPRNGDCPIATQYDGITWLVRGALLPAPCFAPPHPSPCRRSS